MSDQERVYIKPIQRKTKKPLKENNKNIIVNDDNFGLSYFENDQDDFQILSEDFLGKCILLDSKDDNEILKKNKIGDNQFFQLNQFIQKNTHPIEIKNCLKQQNYENDENFASFETRSNLSYGDDFPKDDFLMIQLSEIDYLEELTYIQNLSVGLKKQKYNILKHVLKNNITNKNIIPKIQKKNIIKKNKNT